MQSNCLFCQIISGDIPSHRVYEDDAVVAFLDIHPVNPGHTLVVPRAHSTSLLDARPEDIHRALDVVQKLAPAIVTATGATAFNVGQNNGHDAGQVVPHLHLHIMPRFSGDGRELWHGTQATPDELKNTALKIISLI